VTVRAVPANKTKFRSRRFVPVVVAGLAVMFGALAPISPAGGTPTCAPPATGEPMFITDDCVDPRFNDPFIDMDEQRTLPVPHRYVHGGFTGTDAKFSFYFPPANQYKSRFFQGPTHQLTTSENLGNDGISFALASGAYAVQTNMGGSEAARTTEDVLFNGKDPAVVGYRVNAAAAKYSREVAAEMYGPHRPYGYLHGGSGGAFQTISGLENTTVWDGGVPFVLGSPNAIPSVFTVRIHALRILRAGNKFPGIMDAIDPGGSGDPYAALNEEERGALEEATRLGFPLRGWWSHATMTGGALALVASYVPYLDPTYFDDYWNLPGYLGHDDPYGSVAAARIQHDATVVSVITGPPRRLELTSVPTGDLVGSDIVILSGAAAGQRVALGSVAGNTVGFGFGANPAVVNAITAGDQVRIDNSNYLALQTYHRHQIGTPDQNFYPFDQFRNPDGTPIYPQRSVLVGPVGQFNGSGGNMTGEFHGKMIVQESLVDIDALPWQADWYRTEVQEHLGNKLDDSFRLYFHDYAQHGSPVGNAANARTVSYQGALQQDLRDLSAWVEQGVKPPRSTSYEVEDGQVLVPSNAGSRMGIQPVAELTVNVGARADVAVGQAVEFSAKIQAPPGAGQIVGAEWDFEGVGTYPVPADIGAVRPSVNLTATHAFTQPGIYFPVIRVTSQREGDPNTPFARVQNLARVRVVVT
jgi:hypothetical protein